MAEDYERYRGHSRIDPTPSGPPPGAGQIGSAVGRQPALNSPRDQATVIDLLGRVSPADGGPTNGLPGPTRGGEADYRLVTAILNFQNMMASRGLLIKKYCDARVDPHGATLALLNRFAQGRGGGGGNLIPIDPIPPRPSPPKGRGFLESLFGQMYPRPTNLSISGNPSISLSLGPVGVAFGRMTIANSRIPGSRISLLMGSGGLSLGPYPGGMEISPSDAPSLSSAPIIHAGPRTQSTTLAVDDILGFCLLVGISDGMLAGVNSTTVLFNIGSNRPLPELGHDLAGLLGGPNGFLADSFRTCKAYACTLGVFLGWSAGVSLVEVLLRREGSDIRPDPDVRKNAERFL